MIYDVAVIGAGVSGAMIASELSHYDMKVALVERCNDVAMGTSKANSAIVHAGFDAIPGTSKAKFNVEGTAMMAATCERLHVPFKPIGSLVIAFTQEEIKTLEELLARGVENGVPGLEILDQAKLRAAEPFINEQALAALYAPSAGIVCPYELTIAAAENAVINGTELLRNFCVDKIEFADGVFTVSAGTQSLQARYIVNAAGVFCDTVAEMIGDTSVTATPRKGEYMLYDKTVGHLAKHVIFQCPNPMGKGVLVTPTVDGNLLIGPTATDLPHDEKTNVATTASMLSKVISTAQKSVPCLTTREIITSFAGLRAHLECDDFIIGPSEKNAQFINVAGIESPGLSASPAIAVYVKDMLVAKLGKAKKAAFEPGRKAPVRFRHLSQEERRALIAKDPAYGRIICRCETVTEGEIRDAILAPAGARDVDGVKRRTRAGMGRCQGGFCGSKVVELLSELCDKELNEITKFGEGSEILYERTK